jgi:hypothetical protein
MKGSDTYTPKTPTVDAGPSKEVSNARPKRNIILPQKLRSDFIVYK